MSNFPISHPTPIITVASGKGGVGKTSITLNLASQLAKAGLNVLVFDADFGLANVDVQLGLAPKADLASIMHGSAKLADISLKSGHGFDVIPGRSGETALSFMSVLEQQTIFNGLRQLSAHYDIVLVDAPAGLDQKALALCAFADHTLLVTTPDPSSITDSYAVLKLLKKQYNTHNCQILLNQTTGQLEAKRTFTKLAAAAENFLGIKPVLLGTIPADRQYGAAVKLQKVASAAFPNTKAVTMLKEISRKLHPHKLGLRKAS